MVSRHKNTMCLLQALTTTALPLLGCGPESIAQGPGALRAAFPQRAAEVLERRAEFSDVGHAFVWKLPPEAGAWLWVEAELPREAGESVRLRVRGFEVEVRELETEGRAEVVERAIAYRRAGGTSYWTIAGGVVEEWLHLTEPRKEVAASWEVAGGRLEQRGEHVAVCDDSGVARMYASAPAAYGAGGRAVQARLRVHGTRIELSVDAEEGEEVLVDPAWTAGSPMNTPRVEHTATLLPDGRVLVTGGNDLVHLASFELYDPKLNKWLQGPTGMSHARSQHTATLLEETGTPRDGMVLVTGGYNAVDGDLVFTELFDPAENAWSSSDTMSQARRRHTATLTNGKVLVAGGFGPGPIMVKGSVKPGQASLQNEQNLDGELSTAELFDPSQPPDYWQDAAGMSVTRDGHTATLSKGAVLVVGGTPWYKAWQLYESGTWSASGDIGYSREAHTATPLPDGRVLVAGGLHAPTAVEVYDPDNPGAEWSEVASMTQARRLHTATALKDGNVLMVGGFDEASGILASAELYDPVADTWSLAGSMVNARRGHTAVRLDSDDPTIDGTVMVAGGRNGGALASIDLYRPLPLGDACVSAGECESGFCADGVCCDTACDAGQCDACSTAGGAATNGTCQAVAGKCDDGDPCTESDKCQADGACAGAPLDCSLVDPCLDPGVCNAATGACEPVPKLDGTPCDDGKKCTTGDGCLAGECQGEAKQCAAIDACHLPGACNPGTGQCSSPEKPGCTGGAGGSSSVAGSEFMLCATDDDCPPCAGSDTDCVERRNCVNGICCTSECSGDCQSCVELGAIGTCKTVCQASLDCVSTCAELAECANGATGAVCAAAECDEDGVHVLTRATCAADGAPCPERARLSCAPYRCIDVLGACRQDCSSVHDCAPPNVCDLAGECVEIPATAEASLQGGCSVAPGRGAARRGGTAGLLLVLAAVLRQRRRRRLSRSSLEPVTAAVMSGSLAACALLVIGCGAEAEEPDPRALRRAFPEHAAKVLEQGRGFEGGSAWKTPPQAGPWVRVEVELPEDGDGFIRLRVRDFEVRVREEGASGRGQAIEQAVAYRRAGGTSYWTMAGSGAEEWLHLEGGHGDAALAWEVEGGQLAQRGEQVAVLDENGKARLWVSAPAAYSTGGEPVQAQLRARGARIELSVDSGDAEALVDPLWTAVKPMSAMRSNHSATTLGDGALVAGGSVVSPPAGVERYDPSTNDWLPAGSLKAPRFAHTATSIGGKVLVAGGGGGGVILSSAELYDPVTNDWSFAPPMSQKRMFHTATWLDVGGAEKVLVAGGSAGLLTTDSAEEYSFQDGWQDAPPLLTARGLHTATALASGTVLVTGGVDVQQAVLNSAELYHPEMMPPAWTPAGNLSQARQGHAATLLKDGRVLITGGSASNVYPTSAELYDPATNSWTVTGSMQQPRNGHTATLLGDGRVLVTGGFNPNDGYLASAELYDPAAGSWSPIESMSSGRFDHTATLLEGGAVLIAGGSSEGIDLSTAELYGAYEPGAPCASAGQCQSGFCVEGVCCDQACEGGCSTCAEGTCEPLTGTHCDDGNACTSLDACKNGVCLGGEPVHCPAPDQCREPGVCDPATGECGKSPAKPDGVPCNDGDPCTFSVLGDFHDTCSGGVCTGSIQVECFAPDLCHAAGSCDPATGQCDSPRKPGCLLVDEHEAGKHPCQDEVPPDNNQCAPGPAAELCSTNADCPPLCPDCPPRFCTDGVCCDEICDGVCHSCVLPGKIGTCSPAPEGRDPRDDCYPGPDCERTCDGNGQCVTVGATFFVTTKCAPVECAADGVHLLGSATCEGASADCPTAERLVYSCAPYRCIDAIGACGKGCASVDDCAPPFVCAPDEGGASDCGDGSCGCVPPSSGANAPLRRDSGCSVVPGSGASGSGGAALLLLALVTALCRRSSRLRPAGTGDNAPVALGAAPDGRGASVSEDAHVAGDRA
jgi:N-acetylneuraminic acid mutarotase